MKKILFVLAAVIFSSHLSAQSDTTLLDEAVLTPGKRDQKQSQTGKVVSVISKEELEKSSGKTLTQLLSEQAGVSIAGAYNAPGSVQTVFLRGASSGRALILVDGIPVSDPSMINNEFDLNLISIHDIERIEICKGAQSTLYGSDAIGGAINIITIKKDLDKPFGAKGLLSYGNRSTFRGQAQIFGKVENKLTYTARLGYFSTDGFSAAYDSTGNANYDDDGYRSAFVNAHLQYQFIPELSAKAFIQYNKYRADVDAAVFADDRDYFIVNDNTRAGAGLYFKKGRVSAVANYHHGNVGRTYTNDSLHRVGFAYYEKNLYKAGTDYAELYTNLEIKHWLTLLAGYDYRKGNMSQEYYSQSGFGPFNSEFNDTSMHQHSYYSSLFFTFFNEKLNIEIGGRINKHSRYGRNCTYTFNPSYKIDDHWRIFGSIASGFKTPSIFQLVDGLSGDPNLKPENSTNYELGIQQLHPRIGTRLVYFHRDIDNGIDFNYNNFKYYNAVKQKVNGWEFELNAKPSSQFSISANYTLITGEETTQSRENFNITTYDYLLRRPRHSLNLHAGYQFDKPVYVRLGCRMVSKRYDTGGFGSKDVLLDGFFLLNAYAEYRLKKYFRFFADLQNITDTDYFDIRGYTAQPFTASAGVVFNW